MLKLRNDEHMTPHHTIYKPCRYRAGYAWWSLFITFLYLVFAVRAASETEIMRRSRCTVLFLMVVDIYGFVYSITAC